MSFVDEMRNLREDIESGKQIRKQRIQEIKEDLSAFMKDLSRKREEDFKALTEKIDQRLVDLKKEVANLKKESKASQKATQAEQKELKKMLVEAKTAFWGRGSKLPSKKGEEL